MNLKKYAFDILFVFAVTSTSTLSAQSIDNISLTLFNQNITMPGRNMLSGWNLGLALGAEKIYSSGKHCSLYQNISLGYYRHQFYGGEMNINTQFGIRYNLGDFFAEFKLGPGYALQHPTQPHFNQIDGGYEAQTWAHKLTAGGGLGIGLVLNRYSVALGWSWQIMYPHLKQESNIMPRQAVEISLRYKLSNIKQSCRQ